MEVQTRMGHKTHTVHPILMEQLVRQRQPRIKATPTMVLQAAIHFQADQQDLLEQRPIPLARLELTGLAQRDLMAQVLQAVSGRLRRSPVHRLL
jgi:hypothetical protein